MSDEQVNANVPEDFIEQIKEVLEKLYDFSALQRHPLAQVFEWDAVDSNEAAGHKLRRRLIDAIETLNPGHDVAVRSNEARIYNLMHLHYIGRMTLQECALEVGISLRQVYRDLRRGQESVGAILWFSQKTDAPDGLLTEPDELSFINSEITLLDAAVTTIHLQKMLETALRAIQKLADRHSIDIQIEMPQEPTIITANPVIAQQVLIHLLSQTVQQMLPQQLRVSLEETDNGVHLILAFPAQSNHHAQPHIEPLIKSMMDRIHWKMQYRAEANERQIVIRAVQEGALLLIIDDNQGLVDLLERYFTGNRYKVVSAHNGEDALHMVQHMLPDAIIMDLMMPGMDGWELLQRLRTNSDTRDIPVIICSVINDPELGYSLGASKFVVKPVAKETLLNALHELNI